MLGMINDLTEVKNKNLVLGKCPICSECEIRTLDLLFSISLKFCASLWGNLALYVYALQSEDWVKILS